MTFRACAPTTPGAGALFRGREQPPVPTRYARGTAYFYSNPWPFDPNLTDRDLPHGASWHTEGWAGTMLSFSAIAGSSDGGQRLLEYYQRVFEIALPTLVDQQPTSRVTCVPHTGEVDGAATILHADLDAFYASVEVRDDPSLRGLPVAVGGGVILAATYEARVFGVASAMNGAEARRRCPNLRVVPARFGVYVEASRRVMEILERFTPLVQAISIDEAFLDVSGAIGLFGSPEDIARAIRAAVRSEVGLPISVGVATTKHLAKIASRVAKPDGLVVVPPGHENDFLHPLPVQYLWGVGPVGQERLARYGIHTIGELAAVRPSTLATWMGDHWGSHLWHLANNDDRRRVDREHSAGSVGAQSAARATDVETRHRHLLSLAERIGTRLRRKELAGRRVTVRVRFGDMTAATRAETLPGPVSETSAIYHEAAALVDALVAERAEGREVNLVGISISLLHHLPHVQLELPLDGLGGDPVVRAGSTVNVAQRDLDAAVDRARARFGSDAVRRAAVVGHDPEQRSPIDELSALEGPGASNQPAR